MGGGMGGAAPGQFGFQNDVQQANDIDDNIQKTKVSRIEVTDENDFSNDDIGKKVFWNQYIS